MDDWKDTLLVGICACLAFCFVGMILFGVGSVFVAFGWWVLRLSGLVG